MKIIHIVESFAGGVFDFVLDLSNGMPNHEHVIIYATREHTPEHFRQQFSTKTKFIHWGQATRELNPIQDYKAYKELIAIIKELSDIDVIHLHSSKAGFIGRAVANRLGLKKKVIYTPHGVSFLRQDVSSIKHKLFVYLEKIGAWLGGKVVACSSSEAEEFHKHNIDAQYINNGVECHVLEYSHLQKNKLRVGTIGRITYPKNPSLFNEIAESFMHNKQLEFVWIGGGGELEDDLTSPNIIKTGWLTRDGVNSALSQLDIYLSTSLWEGLPLSVLQAMCFEKPLLLSNCVGNRDLVQNGYNGVLFNTFDEAKQGLEKLLNDREKLKLYGKNSKQLLLNNFTIGKTVENYEKLYQSILYN
jgi:glycosyltransferase involved in cell wall biosynthesis